MYCARPVKEHEFKLTGFDVGETFLGCDYCWSTYPVVAGVNLCPNCGDKRKLKICTVEASDKE